MGELSPWHLLILAAVFVILFGSRKLPDAARSIGRSMRILRAETTKGMHEDDEATDQVRAQNVQQTATQQPPAAPAQLPPPANDGTVVSGVPLAEAQRNQQST
ncbi:MAG: Sec-independent protein translocase subunit TatA [Micromonosporaceae bacterium]